MRQRAQVRPGSCVQMLAGAKTAPGMFLWGLRRWEEQGARVQAQSSRHLPSPSRLQAVSRATLTFYST